MISKLSSMAVPFPFRLMSSNKTATNMTQDFARDIRNMYVEQNGAGVKRNGLTQPFAAVGAVGGNIKHLVCYVSPIGAVKYLAFKDDGILYLLNDVTNTWDVLYSGLDASAKLRHVHFAGKLILCNGVNDVLVYDGVLVKPITQWVKETGTNLTYVDATHFTVESDVSFYDVGVKSACI